MAVIMDADFCKKALSLAMIFTEIDIIDIKLSEKKKLCNIHWAIGGILDILILPELDGQHRGQHRVHTFI